jgi:hypothetical protein
VIRTYSGDGAKELFDLLEKRKADVESLIRSVKGFVSYALVRTGDGGISVTVCQDKAGTDESLQKAKDWIGKHGSNIGSQCTESVRRSGYSSLEMMGLAVALEIRPRDAEIVEGGFRGDAGTPKIAPSPGQHSRARRMIKANRKERGPINPALAP